MPIACLAVECRVIDVIDVIDVIGVIDAIDAIDMIDKIDVWCGYICNRRNQQERAEKKVIEIVWSYHWNKMHGETIE